MDLRQLRGFGPLDPWPVKACARTEGEARACAVTCDPEEANRRVRRPEVLVFCKELRTWTSSTRCASCRELAGIMALPTSRSDPTTVRPYRIRCRWPVARVLTPTGREIDRPYAARLEAGAAALGRRPTRGLRALFGLGRPGELSRQERRVFLRREHVSTCPLVARSTGRWLVRGPACVACPHYRGLVHGQAAGVRRGPVQALCDHESGAPLREVVQGERALVGAGE